MKTNNSFHKLEIASQFDSFFNEIYIEWEEAWNRKKAFIGTEFYKVEGNLSNWKKYYLNQSITLLIFKIKDSTIGYLGFEAVNTSINITEVLIKKEFRGKGYGTLLLSEFFQYIKLQQIDFENYTIETHSRNVSNKIYLKSLNPFLLK